jgi:hypothetical protein
MSVNEAVKLLEEESRDAFAFNDEGVAWRSRRLTVQQIYRARNGCAISFGSCSFREPLEDLERINLLH